jgi:hypothetical protein
VGDPFDPQTEQAHKWTKLGEKVMGYIESGRKEGAKLVRRPTSWGSQLFHLADSVCRRSG